MSRIQEEVKPILVPLLLDEWTQLDERHHLTLAKWVTMTTMVMEFADPYTAAIPQSHRTMFFLKNQPIDGWYIWIGRQDTEDAHPAYFNHFGWKKIGYNLTQNSLPQVYCFQITTFAVGKLLIHVFMDGGRGKFYAAEYADQFGLRTVFPFTGHNIKKPAAIHDYGTRQFVSDYLAKEFGFKPFRARKDG